MIASGSIAGDAYGQLIKEQLDYDRAVKASLEQRAVTVITTSGVLVSLLFALAATVTDIEGFEPPFAARVLLAFAMGSFLVAAILGIAVNRPRDYEVTGQAGLRRIIEEQFWVGPSEIGSRRSAEVRVDMILSAREANRRKGKLLLGAMVLEVAAVALVGIAVAVILLAD